MLTSLLGVPYQPILSYDVDARCLDVILKKDRCFLVSKVMLGRALRPRWYRVGRASLRLEQMQRRLKGVSRSMQTKAESGIQQNPAIIPKLYV
jgi:hypothetical protein